MKNLDRNRILVIVVTYNAMQWVERCFGSLRSSTLVPDVFVVDNGSTDGTQAYIQSHFSEVMFHQSEKNLGFGQANNMGLQYALDYDYDYVYLLNQDAWVMPDTFERLIEISQRHPEYGILSPFQMNADLQHIDSNFAEATCAWKSNMQLLNDLYNHELRYIYSVDGVMAAHWFITQKCIKKVGGFSPSFAHYGEDDNYIDRVKYRGIKIGVVPSLRVVHDRGWRKNSNEKKMYINYTSSIRFLSNPSSNTLKSIIVVLYLTIKDAISFFSLKPLQYLIKIMLSLNTILKNKIISKKKECAFLT